MEKPKLIMLGHLDIRGHDSIKRVYHPEGISPTLTTSRGGNRQVKILDLLKYRVRKLTPNEYGKLQGFPMEGWHQVVSDTQAYKQFGNAVTVTLFCEIAKSIRSCIEQGKGENDGKHE